MLKYYSILAIQTTWKTFEKNVIMIDAFDDISFDRVIEKCTELFLGKTISLITDSQHPQPN